MRIAATVLLLWAACRPAPSTEQSMGANVITIEDTVNYRLAPGVEIAAGNFWPEEFTDEKNQKRNELTVGLWVLTPKTAPQREHLRVHQGQELTAGDRKLKVLEIQRRPMERGYVKLEAVQ